MADTKAKDTKPTYDAMLAEYNSLKKNEPQADVSQLQRQHELATELDKGPENFTEIQSQKAEQFKNDLIERLSSTIKDPGLVSKLAEKAAQRFIVERKTGEQSLVDFLAQEGKLDRGIVKTGLGDFDNLSYLKEHYAPGDFTNEITRLSGVVQKAQDKYASGLKQAGQEDLAASQRQASADVFGQALKAFQTPIPSSTPELDTAKLQQIQQGITTQGETAFSRAEAGFANRGLTGSSIEAYGLGQVEKNVSQQFADATLNYLLTSGQAAANNRNLLASQLFQQSQALLGAGQQSTGQAIAQEQGANQLGLQQDQLTAQIAQFNKTYNESQRQFDVQQKTLQETGAQNLALLMQQLSQGKGKGPISPLLALAGGGLGAAFAAPTGGLSVLAGAGIGAAAGGTAGGLFDYFGGGN